MDAFEGDGLLTRMSKFGLGFTVLGYSEAGEEK